MSKASFNENKSDLKIGVFLCRCGGNISDTIDMEKLRSFGKC